MKLTRTIHLSLADPVFLGTVCCVISAVCYSITNICLRKLADLQADEMWVICLKESVTVSVVGPWLLWQTMRRGRKAWLPRGIMLKLIIVGLGVQLIGNLGVQHALGVVGLAITIPAIFGVMLTASATMGWFLLGERVPWRSVVAIGMLIGSVGLLSIGAESARQAVTSVQQRSSDAGTAFMAVGIACLSGVMFSILTVTIRDTASRQIPVTVIMFLITSVGAVSLGLLCVMRLGFETLSQTPREQFAWMLTAGILNLIGFFAIIKGLHLTTVVHANVLNASQIAIGAVAGVLLFHESNNAWIIVGIVLTLIGVISIGRPLGEEPEAPGA